MSLFLGFKNHTNIAIMANSNKILFLFCVSWGLVAHIPMQGCSMRSPAKSAPFLVSDPSSVLWYNTKTGTILCGFCANTAIPGEGNILLSSGTFQ